MKLGIAAFGSWLLALGFFVISCEDAYSQSFDDFFEDNTLRVDYIFGGDSAKQYIQMTQLYKQPHWAGRRARLSEQFLQGNGQIRMTDHATGQLLYVHTFSTLFQEWILEEEATRMMRGFEATYLLPYPKRPVDVCVTLTDNHHRVTTSMSHLVDPNDILIRSLSGLSGSSGSRYLVQSGDIKDCVDLALVAEGYTAEEQDKFWTDAQRAVDALFSHEPFATLKSRFNVVAVPTISEQSGPSEPGKGIWHDTTFGSHYDTFYTERYLTTSCVHRLYDVLSSVPVEHVIILVNTPRYGGGGIYNQWMTCSTDHPTFKQVLVHEFGHSYAGLADEYDYGDSHTEWYPRDTEPWEPNITTMKDFSLKWQDMIDAKVPGVGLFEGAGYQKKDTFRPVDECRMKVNQVENFCPVCTRTIERITDFYTAK